MLLVIVIELNDVLLDFEPQLGAQREEPLRADSVGLVDLPLEFLLMLKSLSPKGSCSHLIYPHVELKI